MILLILAALNFTHILDFMIMMPLGNYLMPYFDLNTQQFSFLVAAYSVSAAVSGFLAAFFVDGFDRKNILLFAYTGFLLGTLACGFAPTYWLLFLFRVIAGLFGGLISAQVLAIISDIYTYERRGRAMGAIMSAFAVASTLGVPFALYLAQLISWHAPFIFIAVVGAVIIPLIVFFIPSMDKYIREDRSVKEKLQVLKTVLNDTTQTRALLFSGLIMMGHFLIIPFINPYLEFNSGYPKSVTPMVYLVGGIASFFGANILGWIADKYGKLRVFLVCIFISTVLVYTITNVTAIPFVIVLVLFAAWFVASTGRGVTAQAMVSNVVPAEQRGSFMSFNSSIQQLGTTVAAIVSGMIVTKGSDGKIHHYEWVGYLSIIVLALCGWLSIMIFRKFDITKKPAVDVAIAGDE